MEIIDLHTTGNPRESIAQRLAELKMLLVQGQTKSDEVSKCALPERVRKEKPMPPSSAAQKKTALASPTKPARPPKLSTAPREVSHCFESNRAGKMPADDFILHLLAERGDGLHGHRIVEIAASRVVQLKNPN
jgi:hypothetical protein